MKLSIIQCIFKREKNSKVERGLMLNENKVIIDKNLKLVNKIVWTYTLLPYEGVAIFKL